MARDIDLPDERYTCQSCGRCCTMWTVTVDADRAARLRRHDWGLDADPFVPNRGPGDAFRVRMVGGRCVFLDERNLCRIHGELGYEAKPEGCKAFPLHFAEVGGQTYARLSFYCPSVTAARGKRLSAQMRWVRATRRAAGDVGRSAPLTLDGALPLAPREARALDDALLALLGRGEIPVADRLAAGSGLLRRLRALAAEGDRPPPLRTAIAKAAAPDPAALAAEGRAGGSAARAGPALSLFLGQDCPPGKLARLRRFFAVRAFNLGLAALRSRAMEGRATWRRIRAVAPDLTPAGGPLLTRFLTHKLRGRRHLTGDLTYLSGYNLLCAAFGVANLLARLRAAHEGRDACHDQDVAAAVQAADLLVLEHTTLHHGALFGALTGTLLADPTLPASLLARLGA